MCYADIANARKIEIIYVVSQIAANCAWKNHDPFPVNINGTDLEME